jgi:hypothetical protein
MKPHTETPPDFEGISTEELIELENGYTKLKALSERQLAILQAMISKRLEKTLDIKS